MTTLAEQFEALRPKLLRLAYGQLGSLAESEDVVQEAWLRLQRVEEETRSRDLGAWLTTTVSRLAVEHAALRARASRGLRRPLAARAGHRRARPGRTRRHRRGPLSLALLVVLESLSALRARRVRPARRLRLRLRAGGRNARYGARSPRVSRPRAHAGRSRPGARASRPPPSSSAKRSRPSRGPRARATSRRCSRCCTRTSCSPPTAAASSRPRASRSSVPNASLARSPARGQGRRRRGLRDRRRQRPAGVARRRGRPRHRRQLHGRRRPHRGHRRRAQPLSATSTRYLAFAILLAGRGALRVTLATPCAPPASAAALLHAVYHALHLEDFGAADAVAQTAGLLVVLALPLLAIVVARRERVPMTA